VRQNCSIIDTKNNELALEITKENTELNLGLESIKAKLFLHPASNSPYVPLIPSIPFATYERKIKIVH
jgi:hypothetical protein